MTTTTPRPMPMTTVRRMVAAVAAELPASIRSARTTATWAIVVAGWMVAPYIGYGVRLAFTG